MRRQPMCVYLYEEAAKKPERKNLANIRVGEYEGLPEKFKDPEWGPDYGEPVFNPKAGATVIGAREFLIAYNINLNTRDRKLAQEIAFNLREKGRAKRDKNGNIIRDSYGKAIKTPGKFKDVKADVLAYHYINEEDMKKIEEVKKKKKEKKEGEAAEAPAAPKEAPKKEEKKETSKEEKPAEKKEEKK